MSAAALVAVVSAESFGLCPNDSYSILQIKLYLLLSHMTLELKAREVR